MAPAARRNLKRIAGYVASVGIVAYLLLVVLPEVGDVKEAGELLGERVGAGDVALIGAVVVAHFVAYGATLSTAVPGLPAPTAAGIRIVSGGVGRVLPFGWAVSAGVLLAMLRARGVAFAGAGRALAITGVWNLLTKLSLPLLAVVALAGWGLPWDSRGWATVGLTAMALAAAVLVVWLLLHERVGQWFGGIAERAAGAVARWRDREPDEDMRERVAQFQRKTQDALHERPLAMAGWYLTYHFTHAALLWVALLAVAGPAGVQVTWAEVFAAFAAGYLLTGIPFTPGGVGPFDVVVIGALSLAGEGPGVATAAVAVFRMATYAVYAPAAIIAWPVWQRLKATGEERHTSPADLAAGGGADNDGQERDDPVAQTGVDAWQRPDGEPEDATPHGGGG